MNSRLIYDGKLVRLRVDEMRSAGGHAHHMEVVEHVGGVVGIAFASPRELVMVRQLRYPVGETIWEMPAGLLEPGEDPRAAVGREVREETGFHGGRIERLWSSYPSPGFSTERLEFFALHDLQPGEPHSVAGEELEVRIFELDELWAMLQGGKLPDMKSQLAVSWARARSAD